MHNIAGPVVDEVSVVIIEVLGERKVVEVSFQLAELVDLFEERIDVSRRIEGNSFEAFRSSQVGDTSQRERRRCVGVDEVHSSRTDSAVFTSDSLLVARRRAHPEQVVNVTLALPSPESDDGLNRLGEVIRRAVTKIKKI